MKHDPITGDLEKDPLWDLLRQRPATRPGPDFAANVVRAARLEEPAKPWWSRLILPLSVGSALAGVAAVAAMVFVLQSDPVAPTGTVVTIAPDSSLADLQDDYETEVFLAASDHLGKYSDEELVSMIGF